MKHDFDRTHPKEIHKAKINFLLLSFKEALEKSGSFDREILIEQIIEKFGENNLNHIFGLFNGLAHSQLAKEQPEIIQQIAEDIFLFMNKLIEQDVTPDLDSLAIHLDILFEKKDRLYNPSADQILSLIKTALSHASKLPTHETYNQKTDLLLPNLYWQIGDLFRLSQKHFTLLEILWEFFIVDNKQTNIHQFFAQSDVHFPNDFFGISILGSKYSKKDTDVYQKFSKEIFKEWEEIFGNSENGAEMLIIFIDTIANSNPALSSLRILNEAFNQNIDSYADQEPQEVKSKNIQEKISLLNILKVTNKLELPPEFVLQHAEQFGGTVTKYNQDEESNISTIIPKELQSKFLYYILSTTEQLPFLDTKNTIDRILPFLSEDLFSSAEYDYYQIEIVNLILIKRNDNFLQFCLDTIPNLSTLVAQIDKRQEFNITSTLIFREVLHSKLLEELFPIIFAGIKKEVKSTTYRILGDYIFFRDKISREKDDVLKASYQQQLFNYKTELSFYFKFLKILPLEDKKLFVPYLLVAGFEDALIEFRDDLQNVTNEINTHWRDIAIKHDSMDMALYFDKLCQNKDETSTNLKMNFTIFGNLASQTSFEAIVAIKSTQELPQYLQELDVTEHGDTGIQQLQMAVAKIKNQIINEEITHSFILNTLALDIFFNLVRNKKNTYGIQTKQALFDRCLFLHKKQEYSSLDPFFHASEEFPVATLNTQALDEFKISDDTIQATKLLDNEFLHAISLNHNPSASQESLAECKNLLSELIDKTKNNLKNITNEKAQFHLENTLKNLESIKISNWQDILQHLDILIQKKEFHIYIRQAFLQMTLQKNQNLPNVSQISNLTGLDALNFLRTIEEDILTSIGDNLSELELSLNQKTQHKILDLFYLKAIKTEIKVAENLQQKSGTVSTSFIPTRSFLFELSGELADACWAPKTTYSLAEMYPNVTALIPYINVGKENQRPVGAILLIETTTQTGEKALILRGVNPQQTFINSVEIHDFHEQLLNYITPIAKNKKAQLLIALSPLSGMATTNRPNYFTYLTDTYHNNQDVVLANNTDSTFNGYSIHDCCKLIADYSTTD